MSYAHKSSSDAIHDGTYMLYDIDYSLLVIQWIRVRVTFLKINIFIYRAVRLNNKSKVRDLRQSLRKTQMIYFKSPFHSVPWVDILLNIFSVFVEILVARVVDNII